MAGTTKMAGRCTVAIETMVGTMAVMTKDLPAMAMPATIAGTELTAIIVEPDTTTGKNLPLIAGINGNVPLATDERESTTGGNSLNIQIALAQCFEAPRCGGIINARRVQ